ncbi:methyltransferase domain-containing protein [uncultured Eudoraea sp.]|uniref:methyltransferase domain-containing protein n=1 Tax=uncultured Eudoraea sp. TaxID=1035614 RepID=UPI00260CC8F7|nr:methyltransferase domain-containing protein [uncultured Eudoraea sp.]
MNLNKEYWEERYAVNNLGWDIGAASTPLKEYIDQLEDKNLKILIPGAGNGYEAIYLHKSGFTNVYVLDLARQPLEKIKAEIPEIGDNQLINGDFFDLDLKDFDLILEQTFFCALNPKLRANYVQKMLQLLKQGGKLAGLFFDFPLTPSGPPFGGSAEEYKALFDPFLKIKVLERANNSIPPRKGKELFFIFEK